VSDSRTGPVLLLLLVMLLVGLFVLGVGFGTNDRGAGCDALPTTPAERERLRKKWFSPKSIAAKDLKLAKSPSCHVVGSTIEFTGTCAIVFPASKGMSRDLVLSASSAIDAVIHMESDDQSKPFPDLKASIKSDKTSISIPRDGGRVTLTCGSQSPCKALVH